MSTVAIVVIQVQILVIAFWIGRLSGTAARICIAVECIEKRGRPWLEQIDDKK